MAEINIGGELVPKTMAKKVAKAEYVYDPNQGGKRQSEINEELYQSKDVLPFDRVVASEIPDIAPVTQNKPDEIIYSSFNKKFIAVVGSGSSQMHYYAWPGYEKYVDESNNNAPYDFKVYLCGGKTYVWNGIDLVAGGSEQIQADWNQTNTEAKDYIKNKPTIPEAQIQSDWNQTNNQAKDFIKNKPTIPDTSGLATKQELSSGLVGKVDKVPGKSLSTNDYTNDDKAKVNAAITDVSDKADKTEVNAALALKADEEDLQTLDTQVNDRLDYQEQVIEDLQQLYENLQQSLPEPVTSLPAQGEAGKIYRLAGVNSYADYMYHENDLTTPIKMAEYDNAIDDEIDETSDNLVKNKAIAETYGYYKENSEYLNVDVDGDDKMLEAIKKDGTKEIFGDLEVHGDIINEGLDKKIEDVKKDVQEEIEEALGDLDAEALDCIYLNDESDYLELELDAEDKVLGGRKADGTKFENVPIETPAATINYKEDEDYLEQTIDNEGHLLSARCGDGKLKEYVGIETPKVETDELTLSNAGLKKLEEDFINDGFNPGSGDDVVKSVSVAGVAIPKNLNDVPLPIASTAQYGLMSPQDKTKLGTIQPTINITGSGVTKNAASFGFLPTATAAANNTAIAAALNGGGTILVDVPGIYDISVPIVLSSNTTLIFGANTFVRMQANMYAVINAGAYTRVYDENIKLIGLHLIANGHGPKIIDIHNPDPDIIVGMHGYINFFYIKRLTLCDYVILDQESSGYAAHFCTFEDMLIERCVVYGFKDGIHMSRGKKAVVRDCIMSCYDDGYTLNAVDYVTSAPEIGWLEDILIENCFDLPNPRHASAGFYSRLMGGSWGDWQEGIEVQLGYIAVVETEGVKRMYRVVGHQHERGWKWISHTKPSVTTVGEIEFLDEQVVTRTVNGVTETATMTIPWILYQTQDVRYDGGCRNITIKDAYLYKQRTFTIQYYMDNEWFNAIVPNAKGTAIMDNIIFENVRQLYDEPINDYARFIDANCPINNLHILNCYIKHYRLLVNRKLNIAGLEYPEEVITIAGNTFAHKNNVYLTSFSTGSGTIPNRVRIYGNILEDANAVVSQDGTNFVREDII